MLNQSSLESCTFIGNLNELTSSYEKFACNKGISTRFNKFKKTLDENSLINIG